MKIDQQALDDHQVRLTVEITNDTYEGARRRAARQIAKRVKVPGFRPGKAPYNVIEKQVGPEAIDDEALDIVLEDVYPQVIEETGIKPWGPGTLEKVHEDKEPRVFEFRVPLSPEVTLGEYQDIRLPFKAKKASKKDIDGVLDNLRSQQAQLNEADRAAKEGDLVNAVVSGERDQADEGERSTILPERSYPVVIEKASTDSKNEWPFPGFSRKLIGLKAGDEKTFKHTYANDADFEDLRGASATFKVQVETVNERVLPEANDEFAKSVSEEYETLDALLEEIKKSLKESFENEQLEEYDERIAEALLKDAEIKYAPQMLDHEIGHHIEDLERQLAQQGMDIETYLRSRDMDLAALQDEARPSVEERLRRSLALMQVAEEENIEVESEELQKLVEARVAELQQALSEEEARRLLNQEAMQNLIQRTLSQEIVRRTQERLRSIAKGEAEAAKEAAQKEAEGAKQEAPPAADEALLETESSSENDQ